MKEGICTICNKKFIKKFRSKSCSKKCGYTLMTKHFEKKCPTCGIIFKSRAIHCSNKCRGISIRNIPKYYIVKLSQLSDEQHFDRLKESFENKVIKQDGCWGFKGKTRTDGYAGIEYKGKNLLIHRASWLIHNGSLPQNLCVLHKCDNRICSNPNHLFLGTQEDNIRDMVLKKRNSAPIGEKVSISKLKSEQVMQIKKLLAQKMTIKKIAQLFNISFITISDIKRNKTWRHISTEN